MPSSRFTSLRNAFLSGFLLLAPLSVTLWILSRILEAIGGTFRPLFFFYIPNSLLEHPVLEVVWNILATLIVIALVTALGYASRYVFSKYFGGLAERFIQGIPGIGTVYTSIKQIVDTFGGQNRHMFSKVVLIEFPRKGAYTIGFLTSVARGEAQAKTSEDVVNVFVPTTPNPTSGFLILVPKRELIELDMSVGDGMKMIISGGAVTPPWPPASAPAGR